MTPFTDESKESHPKSPSANQGGGAAPGLGLLGQRSILHLGGCSLSKASCGFPVYNISFPLQAENKEAQRGLMMRPEDTQPK